MKSVVDTNIINRLIDGSLSTDDLPADELVATHIQIDELRRTPNAERRGRLLLRFETLVDSVVPTESMVLGVSRLDESKLGSGDLCRELKADLDSRNGGKENNTQDALIAEVATANGWTLLTADRDLAAVAKGLGCIVCYFKPPPPRRK